MAITINNLQTAATTASLSYTPSNVADSVLVVFVGQEDVSNDEGITGIDFGVTPMTIAVSSYPAGTHANDSVIAYLKNPGTSAKTITVNGSENARTGIIAMTLGGVDQTTVVDVTNSASVADSDSPHSIATSAATTVSDTLVVSGCSFSVGSGALGLTGGTLQADIKPGATADVGAATSDQASAGTYTHTWTHPSGLANQRFSAVSAAFKPSAGGGTTVSPNNASQTQSVGSPTLTQHGLLTVQSLSQSQSVSQPTLGGAVNLPVNSLTQAQSISISALLQHHVLSVDGLAQAQSASAPVMTQAHVLAVDGLTQAQTAQSASLAIAGVLSVAGITQQQLSGSPALSAQYQLLVDSLTQAATVSQPVVSLDNSLAVAGLTQAQIAANSELLQHGVLAVDSLTQAQLLSISQGAAVIGWLSGRLVIVPALGAQVDITPALSGSIKLH